MSLRTPHRFRSATFTAAAMVALGTFTACQPTVPIPRPGSAAVAPAGEQAVRSARSEIGTPYRWGGRTPGAGFDCSGLTSWAWEGAGKAIPRSSRDQYAATTRISRADLRAGDLVFYAASGTTVSHVALYVGDGRIVHARRSGTNVEYQSIDWWASNRVGYGRLRA